ncbi:MAG: hypothetical protein M3237_09395 [Actinomycetota bacterium]|nr:hypothetical protein [Actinomycetota bacterium]
MHSDETPEIPIAEHVLDDTSATVDGAVIGAIDGLLWEDTSGVDIVCVTIDAGQVAVPVDHDEWRVSGVVELRYDETMVKDAPPLGLLQHLASTDVIEQIADHYSVNLGGPPPGPDPQPLPPWWSAGEDQ